LLKARIKNVGEWKAILNAIGDIVEDAMFIVNTDGITFRGMDPSHVALLDVTFPKSSFEELESKTSFFGIKVNDLKTVLNSASNDDSIEMNIEDNTIMKVIIKGTLDMEYNIRLIQRQEVNTPIPNTEYKAKLSLGTHTLSRILANIERISDYVKIDCNTSRVEFSGRGDAGDAKINLERSNPELKNIELDENSSSTYSLEFMAKIIRDLGKTTNLVNMEYAERNPIHILFQMPSNITVNYYLAPRVET